MTKPDITIEFHQADFIPGFAAYLAPDKFNPESKAICVLNIGSIMAMVAQGDIDENELPYMIADSMMHEIIHVLEHWACVEFSEERVDALIDKYRAHYQESN